MNVTVIALTVEMGRVLMYRALTLVSALLATSSTLTSNIVLVNSWIVIISMISVMTAYICITGFCGHYSDHAMTVE